jgi:hypothetical protein
MVVVEAGSRSYRRDEAVPVACPEPSVSTRPRSEPSVTVTEPTVRLRSVIFHILESNSHQFQ